jgi:surface antigen
MKRMALVAMLLIGALLSAAVAFGQDDLAAPEQQAMSDTVQNALENNPSNQSSDWVNPDSGNSGGVTPVRTFTGSQGQPCREFISTIVIGGEEQQGYGTACRQPDGSWQIVSGESADQREAPAEAQTNVYLNNPPPQYYAYPATLYSPYHIYLSFGYVYHGGSLYRGSYFLDGRSFRNRYPISIHQRVFITPRDRDRYYRQRSWWGYRERERVREKDRYQDRHEDQRGGWDWRDRDRGNQTWHGRGRKR